jgi:hypothetical protein
MIVVQSEYQLDHRPNTHCELGQAGFSLTSAPGPSKKLDVRAIGRASESKRLRAPPLAFQNHKVLEEPLRQKFGTETSISSAGPGPPVDGGFRNCLPGSERSEPSPARAAATRLRGAGPTNQIGCGGVIINHGGSLTE